MKSKNAKRCRSDLTTIQRLLTKHRRVMLVQKSQREKKGPVSQVSIRSIDSIRLSQILQERHVKNKLFRVGPYWICTQIVNFWITITFEPRTTSVNFNSQKYSLRNKDYDFIYTLHSLGLRKKSNTKVIKLKGVARRIQYRSDSLVRSRVGKNVSIDSGW